MDTFKPKMEKPDLNLSYRDMPENYKKLYSKEQINQALVNDMRRDSEIIRNLERIDKILTLYDNLTAGKFTNPNEDYDYLYGIVKDEDGVDWYNAIFKPKKDGSPFYTIHTPCKQEAVEFAEKYVIISAS